MEHLNTYLNDHLAGAIVALQLLDHLESTHHESDWPSFFRTLRLDIHSDRIELETLMRQLDVDQSVLRKGVGWLSGKFTEAKLAADDPVDGALRLFESLEALSLGIEGKRCLWLALAEAANEQQRLRLLDYDRLISRAIEQRSRVEKRRLLVGKAAFAAS